MPSKSISLLRVIPFGILAFTMPLGNTTLGILVLLLSWFISAVRKPGQAVKCLYYNLPPILRLFLAYLPFNILLSVKPQFSLLVVFGYALVLMTSFACVAAFREEIRKQKTAYIILFMLGTLVSSVFAVYEGFVKGVQRPGSPLVGCNALGTILIFAIPFLLAVTMDSTLKKTIRTAALIILPLSLTALFATQTRGAWLGTTLSLLVFALRSRKTIIASIIILILSLAVLSQNPTFMGRLSSITDITAEGDRIEMWQSTFKMIRDYPLFGIGGGTYSLVYPKYKLPTASEPNQPYAHNILLTIAVEFGLIGAVLFSGVLYKCIRSGFILAKRNVLGHALFAGFCGMLLHQMVDCTTYGLEIGGYFWIIASLMVCYGTRPSINDV